MARDIVIAIFPSRGTLVDAADYVRSLDYLKLHHSAVIVKAESGEAVVLEDDISVSEGSIAGGTLGSLMGALGVAGLGAFLLPGVGPIIAIGAGALIGGLVGGATGGITAGLIDQGVDNKKLDALARHLDAGRVALVLELEGDEAGFARLQEDLKRYNVEFAKP